MPPDFGNWCKRLVDGTEELSDLIEASTDPQHCDLLRREREQQQNIRAENFWREEQAEFTELQTFSSFIEAVNQTAARLGLSLPTEIEITTPFFPSALSTFSTSQRRVNIQAVTSTHRIRPLGYAITLSELAADQLNVIGGGHEGSTKSLDEVILVLYHWLVDRWELERIRNDYEWMKLGVILWH